MLLHDTLHRQIHHVYIRLHSKSYFWILRAFLQSQLYDSISECTSVLPWGDNYCYNARYTGFACGWSETLSNAECSAAPVVARSDTWASPNAVEVFRVQSGWSYVNCFRIIKQAPSGLVSATNNCSIDLFTSALRVNICDVRQLSKWTLTLHAFYQHSYKPHWLILPTVLQTSLTFF